MSMSEIIKFLDRKVDIGPGYIVEIMIHLITNAKEALGIQDLSFRQKDSETSFPILPILIGEIIVGHIIIIHFNSAMVKVIINGYPEFIKDDQIYEFFWLLAFLVVHMDSDDYEINGIYNLTDDEDDDEDLKSPNGELLRPSSKRRNIIETMCRAWARRDALDGNLDDFLAEWRELSQGPYITAEYFRERLREAGEKGLIIKVNNRWRLPR
jgi:hypothetical protein